MASVDSTEDATLLAVNNVPTDQNVHQVKEEVTAVPTMSVASSETSSVLSKRASKKAKKPKVEESPPTTTEAEVNQTIDHPYLSFLHKRIRLYKKKMEKIRALETACANDGKVLNDQQQEVVSNKALVERMIIEFETLREQFIEVYKKEQAEITTAMPPNEPMGTPVVEESKEIEKETEKDKSGELPRDALAYVEDLLRTLHAVTLHQALGKEVPPVLDYFSKVVLGTTRPPAEVPFEENLAESMEEATRYLTNSEKIVVQDYTYKDLRTMMEQLGAPSTSASNEDEEASSSVVVEEEFVVVEEIEPEVRAPAAEALPHINFFTDSQLVETPAAPEEVSIEVFTEDKKDKVHEQSPEAIELEEVIAQECPVDTESAPTDAAVETAPPKSFAVAAGASNGKNVWSRKPKAVTTPANGSGDEKPHQRRRSQGRSKNNHSNSPHNGDGKHVEGSNGASGPHKPRRPRPQRTNDENSGAHNTNRPQNGGHKHDDRRPRSERPARKPQPPKPTQA